ncbi:MAG: helix-turn-helix domain-containing protein [Opitutaceae bacterium]|nr:helix-turn-helix domain-containing protein [Opitutaceae bacterium]
MVTFDPNRPDFTPYGLTCVRWTPSPMRRPDHHNEIELNFLTSGSVTYLLGGRVVKVEADELAVFWASIPHQIKEFDHDTRYFAATIPLSWFLQCRFPERFVQPLLRGEVISENVSCRVQQDRDLFSQWESDLANADEDVRHLVMLEMEARLRRLLRSLPASSDAAGSARSRRRAAPLHCGELNKVEQMACLIAQRYTEALTVEEIGRCVGLHPNYAMGLFKKAFGTTLIDYLTRHRVSHAQRLLATTDEKILEIAMTSGFNSLSRFNEAFRRVCGCTPREYRIEHPFGSPA